MFELSWLVAFILLRLLFLRIIKLIVLWHLTQHDLLNIDYLYFEGMVDQIYPPELQLKMLILQIPRPLLDLHLSVLFPSNFMINAMTLSLVVRNPVFGISDLVPHKPGCAVTEDG